MFISAIRACGIVFAALVLFGTPAHSLTIGTPDDPNGGNTFPFGNNTGNRYQQAYAASNFSGPVVITGINFFAGGSATNLSRSYTGGTFTLYLSTTPLGVNNLNETSNFDANRGVDNQLFAVRTLTGTVDPVLAFTGTAFAYDPSLGDLLLDISVTGSASTSASFVEDSGNGGIMSRAHDFGNGFDNRGLVTEFVFGEIVAMPAPAPLAILTIGIGLVALRRARR